MTRFVDRLKRHKQVESLDGFQCICTFFTSDPDVAAAHFHSRGKGRDYRNLHHTLICVKDGINLLTEKSVAETKRITREAMEMIWVHKRYCRSGFHDRRHHVAG